jgi:hypothetical protein
MRERGTKPQRVKWDSMGLLQNSLQQYSINQTTIDNKNALQSGAPAAETYMTEDKISNADFAKATMRTGNMS